jgi:hypothetical protein
MRPQSTILLLLPLLLGSGCGVEPPPEPVTFQSWQTNLEHYIWNEANGDPNVLRDMSWDDVHHGFAIISDALPDRSTDAIGLLVAHRKIGGEPCFVFLFALIRTRMPIEMRAVALNVTSGQFRWFVGADDLAALDRYRSVSGGGVFPARADTFDVGFDGQQIVISHQQSGARWSVAISASSQPAGAGP